MLRPIVCQGMTGLLLLVAACGSDPLEELNRCLAYCDYAKRCNGATAAEVRLCEDGCRLANEPGSPHAFSDEELACAAEPVSCEAFIACARAASPSGGLLGDDYEQPDELRAMRKGKLP